jgi:PEGA domain-containing protein
VNKMSKAMVPIRLVVALFLALVVALPLLAQTKEGLHESDILELLRTKLPSAQIVKNIKDLGIEFEMTKELERKFRRAGADDDVIDALDEASKGGGETTTPAQTKGSMAVQTQPGEAQVYLNDEMRGMSSPQGKLRLSELSPGTYQVRVSLIGYESWQQSVTVEAGQTASVYAALTPKSSVTTTQTTPTISSNTTTTYNVSAIPLPDVKVDEVKFFECGTTIPDVGKRTYQTAFPSATSRNIYWELNLSWGRVASRVDFDVNAVWYDTTGKVFGRNTHASHVEPGWFDEKSNSGGSVHADGWGCDTSPCSAWTQPGTYRVDLYVRGVKIASASFQIQ